MKPAKSWICYFSPTGTSRRVAEAVGRGLNCAQTVVCDATHDAVCVAAERGDDAVFAVPVYGGHAAPLALRRLDAVRGDGTPAVVVVLYGNRAYEHAACELADFVAARGFVPVAAAAFVGEHSYSTARWPIAAGRPDGDDCAEAEAFGITCPLITKADGTKFGKTESGNVWLDPRYTSPYKFYQFWLNVSDEDAKRYIKIFTLLDRETIDALIAEHDAAPHLRVLQKRLAEEITCMIHSREEYEKAVEASAILFGGATSEALHRLDEQTLLQVFEGVPQYRVARTELAAGIPFVDLCAEKSDIFASKGECRKLVQGGGVSLNKEKLADAMRPVTDADLIAGKYLLVQRGKKNYYLVIAE